MTLPGWTPEKQIHYPLIPDTAIAPDGARLVFRIRAPRLTDEESKFIHQLYLLDAGGGTPRQLTYAAADHQQPRWSPDGQTLAFLSDRDGGMNLYAMHVDGGEPWALTALQKGSVGNFRWSPDGKQLAYLLADPPTEEKEAAGKAKNDPILWDVDFDFVHLHLVDVSRGQHPLPAPRRLTTGRFSLLNVDWYPDGTRLAITYMPTPGADSWPETRLATLPAAPGDAPLGPDAVDDLGLIADWTALPLVSPDGQWIACGVGDLPPRWAFSNGIALYPTGGGEPVHLPRTMDEQPWLCGWAADSRAVYAVDAEGLDSQLYRLAIGATQAELLTQSPLRKEGISVAADRLAFVGHDFEGPNSVYLLDIAAGTERRLFQPPLPADWPTALPQVEVIRYPSSDGLEIEGFVVYPYGYEPGRRYPLIVEVHGGPTGVYSRHYLAGLQRYGDSVGLAERGYVLLRTNPRGSSGYGKSFRFANYNDWGGMDYEDIMAGVDLLIARGIVDPQRMGILGWSYGGYMTSWVITKTRRFAAACVGAGVANLMSFNGTADIAGFIPDYFEGQSWEVLEKYIGHSAMFNVAGAVTPTLIQHGENDPRVPLSQGRELYNALKQQGVPVEMVIYPRQGHAVAEPRLRMDVARRSVAWFDRWLQETGD